MAKKKGGHQLDFNGRVAVVTGGAQGIGLAVVKRFLASGATVAIWDRDEKLTKKTLAALKAGKRAIGVAADIGSLPSVEAATKATIKQLGTIDVLINNAAIVGPNIVTWDYPPEDWAKVIHINLVGTFYCCRAVVPHMIKRNYGRIVNVASVAGKEGNPTAGAYSASKAGVLALTKSLGKELATKGIAVNAVTPAVAATTMGLSQPKEHIDYMLAKIPRGRMLELDEAASMICWIASEENSFTTASTFDLSGGRATY
jgi:3-oxoacyl-[acyl-carrier protein] reductase